MKKIVYDRYGDVNVLHIEEATKPVPANQQLLIRVKSVALNPLDWKTFTGEVKLMSGAKFPKMVACDFSGIVEGVGQDVNSFKAGDEVFGVVDPFKEGVLAEYILVDQHLVAIKPHQLSFEQAASIPTAGQSALQMLTKMTTITPGQEVLINGATGGVGMFAIQIAKSNGAIVTAVSSAKGHDLLKKWGSDHVIDYTLRNVTDLKKRFDVVIELSTKLPFSQAKKLMKSKASYITAIPSLPAFINSFLNNIFSGKKYKIMMMKSERESLDFLANEVVKGMDVHISKSYPMSAYKEAYETFSKVSTLGKAVFII